MEIIVDRQRQAVFENSIKAMAEFKAAFGRSLSGDFVAELYAADELGLRVVESGAAGYDAISPEGKRYQVKFRSAQTQNVDINNFDFDYLVLVNLDENYQLSGMWRITKEQAEQIFVERVKFRKYQTSQDMIKRLGELLAPNAVPTNRQSSLWPEKRRWRDIRGAAPYPLLGGDAQKWVTQSRQEDDAGSGAER